jgi:hypothetical protein
VIRKSIREAGRKNFTLAHEIGHFLLPGHDQTELVCTSPMSGIGATDRKRLNARRTNSPRKF